MEKSLSSKNILITGGTSRFGSAFVRKALQAGAHILFTFFEDEKGADDLIRLGALGFRVDLSKTDDVIAAAKSLKSQIEHLDVLIHNAAAIRDRTIQNLSEDDWDTVLTVNLKAPYLLTKELMPVLFLRKKSAPNDAMPAAKIFFLTSRVAFQGGFGVSNYAASKAGVIALAKSLAKELGKRNILVNAVNPGFMKSKMTADLPDNVIEGNLKASPLSRFSDPEEVADFLVYLSSDRMTQVTGQVFSFESRNT